MNLLAGSEKQVEVSDMRKLLEMRENVLASVLRRGCNNPTDEKENWCALVDLT
jgi:hypothetical protein